MARPISRFTTSLLFLALMPGLGSLARAAEDPKSETATAQEKALLAEFLVLAAEYAKMPRYPIDPRIVDPEGQPVAGAQVVVVSVHSGSETFFNVQAEEEIAARLVKDYIRQTSGTTDERGAVRLRVPQYFGIHNRLTESVRLSIQHPKFPKVDITRTIEGIGKDPIVMKRGRTILLRPVKLAGGALRGAYALVARVAGSGHGDRHFVEQPDGALQSDVLDPTLRYVRAFHPRNEPTLFSDEIDLENVPAETLMVTMRPGIRIEGTLDDRVPRPIRDGWVEVCQVDKTTWCAKAPIAADGSFTIPSFPSGRHFQFIAAGEGFVSRPFSRDDLANYARQHHWGPLRNEPDSFTRPQIFPQDGAILRPVLRTQPAATVRVTVLDQGGQPVPDCRVACHIRSSYQGLQGVFLNELTTRERYEPDQDKRNRSESLCYQSNPFAVKTDAAGVATFRNLPPSTRPLEFYLTHDDYRFEKTPFSRTAGEWFEDKFLIPASAGKTTEAVIRVVSKQTAPVRSVPERSALAVVVRDEHGAPVERVVIMPLAVRMTKTGAYHWWSSDQYGLQEAATTDKEGKARIYLPSALSKPEAVSEILVWHHDVGINADRFYRIRIDDRPLVIIRVSRPTDWDEDIVAE